MLKNLVKNMLLPFYESLCDFFRDIFNPYSNYRYVVFVARRCSILAEIFLQVITDEAEPRLLPNYITDSALLSICPRLANVYRRSRRFPSILIVDDVVIYGKSLTAFLEELEEQLWLELQDEGYTKEDVIVALRRAIRIYAFARNNQPLLLDSRYQSNFTVMKTLEPKEWRDFSNRASRLILVSGRINSSFIVGSELPMGPIELTNLSKAGFSVSATTYDAFRETMLCRTTPLPDTSCIIYTIRILPSGVDGTLMAVPFVFVPNMTEQAMNALSQSVLGKLRPHFGHTPLDPDGSWARCPRIKAEALTLLFSVSLLQEFSRLAGVKLRYSYNSKLKLQMNFATQSNKEADNFINRVMDTNIDLLSIEQMEQIILLHSIDMRSRRRYQRWENRWLGELPVYKGSERLKQIVEDYVYKISMSNYAKSFWQTQMFQEQTPSKQDETTDNFTTVTAMMEQLSSICKQQYSLSQVVSWVLQMADAGILSIAVRTFSGENGMYVAQCVKTGEQSQFIMPKRLREFIPVLILIQRKARILGLSFYDEFSRFAKINKAFGAHEQELTEFLYHLSCSGQRLEDWDFDLVTLPDSKSENWISEAGAAFRSMQRQHRYMDEYIASIQTG